MKYVVFINVSNEDVPIPELQKVIPAGTIDAQYTLPWDVAINYKQFFRPIGFYEVNDVPIQPRSVEDIKKELEAELRKELEAKIKEELSAKLVKEKVKTEKLEQELIKVKKKPLRQVKVDRDLLKQKKEQDKLEKLNGKNSND